MLPPKALSEPLSTRCTSPARATGPTWSARMAITAGAGSRAHVPGPTTSNPGGADSFMNSGERRVKSPRPATSFPRASTRVWAPPRRCGGPGRAPERPGTPPDRCGRSGPLERSHAEQQLLAPDRPEPDNRFGILAGASGLEHGPLTPLAVDHLVPDRQLEEFRTTGGRGPSASTGAIESAVRQRHPTAEDAPPRCPPVVR